MNSFSQIRNYAFQNGQSSKFIIVSLSIQPVLSLASKYDIPSEDAFTKLSGNICLPTYTCHDYFLRVFCTGFFKSKGADAVFCTKIAEDLALADTTREFLIRWKNKKSGCTPSLPMLASACPGYFSNFQFEFSCKYSCTHIKNCFLLFQVGFAMLKKHTNFCYLILVLRNRLNKLWGR